MFTDSVIFIIVHFLIFISIVFISECLCCKNGKNCNKITYRKYDFPVQNKYIFKESEELDEFEESEELDEFEESDAYTGNQHEGYRYSEDGGNVIETIGTIFTNILRINEN